MELMSAFAVGALIVGVYVYHKTKLDTEFSTLKAIAHVRIIGKPNLLHDWCLVYSHENILYYKFMNLNDVDSLVDKLPPKTAYQILRGVVFFKSIKDFIESSNCVTD